PAEKFDRQTDGEPAHFRHVSAGTEHLIAADHESGVGDQRRCPQKIGMALHGSNASDDADPPRLFEVAPAERNFRNTLIDDMSRAKLFRYMMRVCDYGCIRAANRPTGHAAGFLVFDVVEG